MIKSRKFLQILTNSHNSCNSKNRELQPPCQKSPDQNMTSKESSNNSLNNRSNTQTIHLSTQIETIFGNQNINKTDEQTSNPENNQITLADFLSHIQTKSFGVLLVITALPIAMPFTPPGVGIPFGLMCIFLSLQMIAGKSSPWFPAWLLNKKIGSADSKLVKLMVKWLKIFENLLKPRLSFLVASPIAKRILAVLVLFCSIVMLIPLPLVNSISALPVFLLGISLVEEDGLFGLLGILSALALLALCVATAFLGIGFLDVVKNRISDGISTTILRRS